MGNKQGNRVNNKNIKKEEVIQPKEIENKTIEVNNTNKTKEIYKYNILFVGEAGIGTKTSLIKRVKEGKFIESSEENKEINHKIIYEKDNKEIILYLIDTNSIIEKQKPISNKVDDEREYIIERFYKNADCIIMGYDITKKQSFEEIKTFWYSKIKDKAKTNLIYLLGNKIDLKDHIEVNENDVKKFVKINKIKHFLISVKNDINIQNLIDDIKINIENIKNNINNGINEKIYGNPSKENYKVVLRGDPATGAKTSLINVLVKGEFDPSVSSTLNASYGTKTIVLKNGNKIISDIWDTAGQEKYMMTKFYFINVECVILGYDITRKDTYENIKNYWYPESKELSNANLFYLIGNKADLYDQEEVSEQEAREYAKNNNMRFFLISCKEKTGIKEFLDDITDELIKN